jgi:hypothetical protein
MTRDGEYHDIIEKFGLPRKEVSCPSCGRVYGAYKRKVCINCQECSKCCECGKSGFVSAEQFVIYLREVV